MQHLPKIKTNHPAKQQAGKGGVGKNASKYLMR
jgi:hypothetical protein